MISHEVVSSRMFCKPELKMPSSGGARGAQAGGAQAGGMRREAQ